MRFWIVISFLLFSCRLFGQSIPTADIDLSSVRKDVIVVKIKNDNTAPGTNPKALKQSSNTPIPFSNAMKPLVSKSSKSTSILDGIYQIELKPGENLKDVLNELRANAEVEYAEPLFLEKLLQIPNDTLAHPTSGSQYYLKLIKAYEAWDITTGSSDIVIGISDTGIDFTHEDISPKIYTNINEIANGIDDDENGFIDDIHGYDFADEDNDAQCGNSYHGNRVAGLAGAATNNLIGMAGVGYNSTISPLKVFPDNSAFAFSAYDGILYAADNGYDIINLSWGSAGTFSQFYQDIIDYAVLEKNLVIIAAGGNSGVEEDFYPASYDHVLSVGWTDDKDNKAGSSTYSYFIDLVAPGQNITSSLNNNGYSTDSGSSYAAPIVAGAAALVKDIYPEYNAEQIMEVLRVTTDDIYTVNNNSNYEGKLGSGRLNIYNALTQDTLRSVRISDVSYSGKYEGYIFFDDSINVSLELKSYLDPITNGTAFISSPSPYLSINSEPIILNFSTSLQTKSFSTEGIYIQSNTPPNTKIPVRIDFADGSYKGFEYFQITTSPDVINLSNDNMGLTAAGNGNLAYSTSSKNSGVGLTWKNKTLVNTLGIMIGNAKDSISDNVTKSQGSNIRDNDFITTNYIKLRESDNADFFASNSFADSIAPNSLGLKVDQKMYAFTDTLLDDFIILEYRLTNLENDTLRDLSMGLFADWQLEVSTQDKGLVDPTTGIAYAYSENETLFAGLKIYGSSNPISQSIDLNSLDGNIPDMELNLTDSVKHELLSKSMFDSAGFAGMMGNDIAQVIASQKIKINPYDSKKITFFIAANDSFEKLKSSIELAEIQYEQILKNPPLEESLVSCNGASLVINPISGTNFRYYKDHLGQELIGSGDTLVIDNITSDTVFYLQNIDSTYATDISVLKINLVEKVAQFQMSADTIYLDHPTVNTVTFTDKSFAAKSWLWDFDNGNTGSNQNPIINFNKAGRYNISLSVETDQGCIDSDVQTLTVAQRPSLPEIENLTTCRGNTVVINDVADNQIKIYTSSAEEKPFFKGTEYVLDQVVKDTVFYISKLENGFESLKKKVEIKVEIPEANFYYIIDTTQISPAILLINDSDNSNDLIWKVDDEAIATSDSISLLIDKSTYNIKLVVTSILGCQDSTSMTLNFTTSPIPTINFEAPCYGESLTLQPKNGNVFGFYRDEALTDLIKKGGSLHLESVVAVQNIYVVGLDNALPSVPILISFEPIEFEFDIVAQPEILDLSSSKNAIFSTNSEDVIGWNWYLDGAYISALPEITILITEAGFHEIICESENNTGCISFDTVLYEVVTKIIQPLNREVSKNISIYPNPTSGKIYLEGIDEDCTIQIYDLTGKMIFTQFFNTTEIKSFDLTDKQSGIYVVHIASLTSNLTYQIILK